MRILSIFLTSLVLFACSDSKKEEVAPQATQESEQKTEATKPEQTNSQEPAQATQQDSNQTNSSDTKPEVKPNEPAQEAKPEQQGTPTSSAPTADEVDDNKDTAAHNIPDVLFQIAQDDIVMGNKKAKVVMIEYSSPSCAHCAYYHEHAFNDIKKEYIDTGKIAYIVRSFIMTKQDLDGAILTLCDKEKSIPFINILYSRQQSWAFSKNYREILTNIGQLGGISPEQYATCLNDGDITEKLMKQTKLFGEKMIAHKIIGTPAFVINGEVLNQPHSFKALATEIEKRLQNNG